MTIGAKRRKCFVYDALDFLKRVSEFFFWSSFLWLSFFIVCTDKNLLHRIFEKCKSELSSCLIKLKDRLDFCKGNTLLSPNFHFQATFCQIQGVINPFSFLMDHFVLLELDKAYHRVTSALKSYLHLTVASILFLSMISYKIYPDSPMQHFRS